MKTARKHMLAREGGTEGTQWAVVMRRYVPCSVTALLLLLFGVLFRFRVWRVLLLLMRMGRSALCSVHGGWMRALLCQRRVRCDDLMV